MYAHNFNSHMSGPINFRISDTEWLFGKINADGYQSNVTALVKGFVANSSLTVTPYYMVYIYLPVSRPSRIMSFKRARRNLLI